MGSDKILEARGVLSFLEHSQSISWEDNSRYDAFSSFYSETCLPVTSPDWS